MRRAADNRNDRPSRLSIFLRRRRRMVRPAALALTLAALAGGAAVTLRDMRSEERFAPIRARLVSMLPLRITDIQVSGRVLTSASALQDALGARIGDPVLGFSVEQARRRIDALPFVDHSVIERHLPGTIIVRLTERRPFAVWQNQGRFMLIDRAGTVVHDQGMTGKDAQAFLQLPLVVGQDANLAAAGLLDALAGQPAVQGRVVAAVRVNQRRWNLLLRDGTTILLPEGEEIPALRRLADLQGSIRLLDRPVIAIDMRLPDRLVIQQPPPPDAGAAPAGGTPAPGAPGQQNAAAAHPAAHPAPSHPAPNHPAPSHPTPGHPAPGHPPSDHPVPDHPPSGHPAVAHAAPLRTAPSALPDGNALPPPVPNLPPPDGESAPRRRA
ncbi:cell division protein FtsQ/DivIB [Nguyenibacter sp. L1]|nr:cell division protein FtsQ/DivIB [Nguyenibacter sp. L1]WRH87727.1 cell division protein FtsQ/DivIB [Nguyenibacter sp. L1]